MHSPVVDALARPPPSIWEEYSSVCLCRHVAWGASTDEIPRAHLLLQRHTTRRQGVSLDEAVVKSVHEVVGPYFGGHSSVC